MSSNTCRVPFFLSSSVPTFSISFVWFILNKSTYDYWEPIIPIYLLLSSLAWISLFNWNIIQKLLNWFTTLVHDGCRVNVKSKVYKRGGGKNPGLLFFTFIFFSICTRILRIKIGWKEGGGIAEVILMLSLFKHGLPTFQPSPLPFVLFVSFTLIGVSP